MTTEERLVAQTREHLATGGATTEVKMFGGIGFLLNGNMVAVVSKRGLLLRIGKDRYEDALAKPGTRPLEMRGRPMEGYIFVDPLTLGKGALKSWLDDASAFVNSLPPKAAKKSKRKRKRT